MKKYSKQILEEISEVLPEMEDGDARGNLDSSN